MNLIILFVIVAIGLAVGIYGGSSSQVMSHARVLEVVDGDTIKVRFDNGSQSTVRLLGVDTPETHHPTKPVGCFGPEAENYSRGQLQGKDVELEYDIEKYDRYDRTLAYVYVQGERFNDDLVANGYAKILTIKPNEKYAYDLLQEEMDAKKNSRGMWGYCTNDN